MHIKICGLTNLDDARVALDAGADLLGFNFYPPSPRYVAPDSAARIIHTLRAEFVFRAVGVFVNTPLDIVRQIQGQCNLDCIQLHGDESAEYVCALSASAFKALRPHAAEEAKSLVEAYLPSPRPSSQRGEGAPRFLVDASHASLYGGTGEIGDWSIAREIAAHHPILLAGGLNPLNVADAIRAVRPWGVDVASGVERAPGVKDAERVRRFIENVKREM